MKRLVAPYVRGCRRTFAAGALSLSLLLGSATEAREKTDVLVLRNGDRLTGEVRKLEYGKLQFKTSDIGTLSVEDACSLAVATGTT